MKIRVKATNIESTTYLNKLIEDKIKDIERLLLGFSKATAEVEVGLTSRHHQKGDIYRAEIQIKIPGKLLRAVSEKEDFRAALTDAKDELQSQIKKHKEKILKVRKIEKE